MRKCRVVPVAAVLALVFSIAGCRYQQSKSAWETVLAQCGAGESFEGGVFFGPSDQAGPGSVWRRTDTGGYNLRWTLLEAKGAGNSPLPVQAGQESACKQASFTLERMFPSLLLTTPLLPMDDGLEADLDKVDRVAVRVRGWAVDRLAEGPYGGMLKSLPADALLRKDFGREAIMAQVSGLRVTGFSVSLEFTAAEAAQMRQKYKDLSIKRGNRGASFTARWASPTVLELAAEKDIYVFGRLSLVTAFSPELRLTAPLLINVFAPDYEDPRLPVLGDK
ncbi:MAG: hypothetical protein HYT99_05020 [Candidatus Tectomicrobia bacterium]|nr:hypothetical protein [Candidatus Tectomicrobia bacterium]